MSAASSNPEENESGGMRFAILIPNYNHKESIARLLDELAEYRLPCVIVNDGSDEETCRVLEEQSRLRDWVTIVNRCKRGGKGAAVMQGLLHLQRAGFTHAIQLDADGQHNPTDAARFLKEAINDPGALILGKPKFGADVPKSRLVGRQLSRVLVWAETLSFAIADPLLGYRIYPLQATVRVFNNSRVGLGMDFDPEIAVRLYWAGVPVRNVQTRVIYPNKGLSHFRMVKDNALMVWLHLRLLLSGLCRVRLLLRKV